MMELFGLYFVKTVVDFLVGTSEYPSLLLHRIRFRACCPVTGVVDGYWVGAKGLRRYSTKTTVPEQTSLSDRNIPK